MRSAASLLCGGAKRPIQTSYRDRQMARRTAFPLQVGAPHELRRRDLDDGCWVSGSEEVDYVGMRATRLKSMCRPPLNSIVNGSGETRFPITALTIDVRMVSLPRVQSSPQGRRSRSAVSVFNDDARDYCPSRVARLDPEKRRHQVGGDLMPPIMGLLRYALSKHRHGAA